MSLIVRWYFAIIYHLIVNNPISLTSFINGPLNKFVDWRSEVEAVRADDDLIMKISSLSTSSTHLGEGRVNSVVCIDWKSPFIL